MPKAKRLTMTLVNHNVRCQLCMGYLIDASTIIECLHSFCRSCIVRYLETSKYCPICDVQVHKTRPLLNIRSDKTLQALVYKIVPGLFKNEMLRRKEFYEKNPQPVSEGAMSMLSKEEKGDMDGSMIYTADEKFSVCIQHTTREPPFRNRSCSSMPYTEQDEGEHRRYLLCPATFTIGLLKKFILAKYGLNKNFRVGIVHSDEVLDEDFTLIDIAYIYGWRRIVPLKLFYLILDITTLPKPQQLPPPSPEKEKELNTEKICIENHENGVVHVPVVEKAAAECVTVPEHANANAKQDSGIAAMVAVPKDDSDKNHVKISVSEDCSDQAMDLSVPQKRDTDGNESVVSISSSSTLDSCIILDTDDTGTKYDEIGEKEIEEEAQREIRGYQKLAMNSKSVSNDSSKAASDAEAGKSEASLPQSSMLNKPNDDALQNTIKNILEALKENSKSDDEEKADKTTEEKMDTSKKSNNDSSESLNQSVESEDKSEPMDTNDQTDDVEDSVKEPSTETEASDNDPDKSSDSLHNLVVIEPEKWKVERCESVHSDKENQSVSPTIVDIIPVNSNLPKVEKLDKFESKEKKESPEDNPNQCSVVVPLPQVPQPVYTVQSLQPPMIPATSKPLATKTTKLTNSPSSVDPKKRANVDNIADNISNISLVKRKRGRPPKVPKDPSQSTPPKIARILPKGIPPQNVGFLPNGMNGMPQGGQWGFPMSNAYMQPNGNVVRVFVQNVQNMAAGQAGGQMMVNGQQQMGQQMNMQQQGINPQFMNQQALMNGQPMMNPQQQFQLSQQQQQQQQQMPSGMNMNAINMNNQMQMMGQQSSLANSGGAQDSTNSSNQNAVAVNQGNNNNNGQSSVENPANPQTGQASVGAVRSGQVPGAMINQMASQGQFNQQMPPGSVNQQMTGRQMLQPTMPGAPLMNTQMPASAHNAVSVSQQNSTTNLRPGASQNFPATSKMTQMFSQPFQNSRMMMLPGGRQPGYPPAPRMPSLPANMKMNNNHFQNKSVKLEKSAALVTSSSLSTSAAPTKTKPSSTSSSVATHEQSGTSESTGLNNGYDAPLELTTKKEPAALEKLSAMQPPIAS